MKTSFAICLACAALAILTVQALDYNPRAGEHSSRQERTAAPPARYQPAVAYDAARDRLVLFGGIGQEGEVLGDTWEWDGSRWIEFDVEGPSPRWGHAMAYDGRRRVVVMFGGAEDYDDSNPAAVKRDTWEWDGAAWRAASRSGPAARHNHAMACDSARGVVVLFGGMERTGRTKFDDTWAWDGRQWTLKAGAGPGARSHLAMAYEESSNSLILFGGNAAQGPFDMDRYLAGVRSDTWRLDGWHWVQVCDSGPSPRDHHAMAGDAARGRVVLFGGYDGGFLDDTWEWDGRQWRLAAESGPPARGGLPGMAFATSCGLVLLFGGGGMEDGQFLAYNDLWGWDGEKWVCFQQARAED